MEGIGGPGEPSRSAREQRQGAAIACQLARGPRLGTTLFTQQEPRRVPSGQNSPRTPALAACPVQNSPSTPTLATYPVQNSPRSPEMAQLGAFSACRESFVPLWLAQHRAGRILYRTQGRDRASQHNNTPGTTGVKAPEGAEGAGGTGRRRRERRNRRNHRTRPRCRGRRGLATAPRE